jgi:hypothetical protein
MHKYLEKKNEVNFDKIFNQVLGEYLRNMVSSLTKDQDVHTQFRVPIYNIIDALHASVGQMEQRRYRLKCGSHNNI